jgi:hypothetical protein
MHHPDDSSNSNMMKVIEDINRTFSGEHNSKAKFVRNFINNTVVVSSNDNSGLTYF